MPARGCWRPTAGWPTLARAAAALGTSVEQLIWLPVGGAERAPGRHAAFDTLAACHAAPPEAELGGADLAQIVYTSGTESLPKGAMLTHDAVIWQYVSCIVDAGIAADDLLAARAAAVPLRPARRVLRSRRSMSARPT